MYFKLIAASELHSLIIIHCSSGSVSAGPGVLAQKINVPAHIKFNVKDKPQKLVKALKKLEVSQWNIIYLHEY